MKNIYIWIILLFFLLFGLPKCTMVISAEAQEPFDRYRSFITWENEMVNLDNFAIYLRRNPTMVGYIVYYIGEEDSAKIVKRRIHKSLTYLVKTRKVENNRLRVICAGKGLEFSTTVLHIIEKTLPPPEEGSGNGCKKPDSR